MRQVYRGWTIALVRKRVRPGCECRLETPLHGRLMSETESMSPTTKKLAPTAAERRERAEHLAARHAARAAELTAINPVTVTPDVAAAMFGVSTAYLRTLEKEDPAFCATWRRGDVATWHPRAVRRRSVAPLLHAASSRLRTTRHRQHVAGQARAGRVAVRQRPAGPLPLERRPEMARSREGVLFRRVVPKTSG